jgi:Sulfotransferase family
VGTRRATRGMPRSNERFFFVHVMKTGGTTMWVHARRSFAADALYPDPRVDPVGPFEAYMNINYLTSLDPSRSARIRCYMGHFPFMVTDALGGGFITMSILRHPVERTVSFLKHWRTLDPRRQHRSLAQLYAAPRVRKLFATNHQTRMFALRPEDRPDSFLEWIAIDEERLELAKANLDRVDLLGIHEHYDHFLAQLRDRYRWQIPMRTKKLASAAEDVSDTLRRRILSDNAADIELYEHARARVELEA